MTLYNENDRFAANWLRELIARNHLEEGRVDDRCIKALEPGQIPARAHFFAGIGGWPYALDLAGYPATAPVWTGSCPCQPFSAAGRGVGADDARHLWPDWFRLIEVRRPPVIFGEQVASRAGRQWFAGVRADLETLGYAVGCADLCAAGVGAPHIRQRLFWVAYAGHAERRSRNLSREMEGRNALRQERKEGSAFAAESRDTGGLAHGEQPGLEGHAGHGDGSHEPGRLQADTAGSVAEGGRAGGLGEPHGAGPVRAETRPGESADTGFWGEAGIVLCIDPKHPERGHTVPRRVEPGIAPLAHGIPQRVGRLRGYGNAIVPQLAARFVRAFMDCAGIVPTTP